MKHQREEPFIPDEDWDLSIRRRVQPQAPPDPRLRRRRRRRRLRAGKSDVQIENPDVVEANIVPLAPLQAGFDEIDPSNSKICS